VWVQTIMKTIQRMAPDGSPLAILAQQGAEAVNHVVAKKSAGVPQEELSVESLIEMFKQLELEHIKPLQCSMLRKSFPEPRPNGLQLSLFLILKLLVSHGVMIESLNLLFVILWGGGGGRIALSRPS
jgi:hypothetical protein